MLVIIVDREVNAMHRIMALLLAVLVPAVFLSARELEGVKLPDTVTVGQSVLTLNGMGVRIKKVAFIKVKVYVAGLYLPAASTDASRILATDEPRQLVMHFVHSEVAREKLVDAWIEGFGKNAGDKMKLLASRRDKFNSFWTDMRAGDLAVLTYVPGVGTRVEIKGAVAGVIEGKEFAEALFSIWLGSSPPNEELKKGLLGL